MDTQASSRNAERGSAAKSQEGAQRRLQPRVTLVFLYMVGLRAGAAVVTSCAWGMFERKTHAPSADGPGRDEVHSVEAQAEAPPTSLQAHIFRVSTPPSQSGEP